MLGGEVNVATSFALCAPHIVVNHRHRLPPLVFSWLLELTWQQTPELRHSRRGRPPLQHIHHLTPRQRLSEQELPRKMNSNFFIKETMHDSDGITYQPT